MNRSNNNNNNNNNMNMNRQRQNFHRGGPPNNMRNMNMRGMGPRGHGGHPDRPFHRDQRMGGGPGYGPGRGPGNGNGPGPGPGGHGPRGHGPGRHGPGGHGPGGRGPQWHGPGPGQGPGQGPGPRPGHRNDHGLRGGPGRGRGGMNNRQMGPGGRGGGGGGPNGNGNGRHMGGNGPNGNGNGPPPPPPGPQRYPGGNGNGNGAPSPMQNNGPMNNFNGPGPMNNNNNNNNFGRRPHGNEPPHAHAHRQRQGPGTGHRPGPGPPMNNNGPGPQNFQSQPNMNYQPPFFQQQQQQQQQQMRPNNGNQMNNNMQQPYQNQSFPQGPLPLQHNQNPSSTSTGQSQSQSHPRQYSQLLQPSIPQAGMPNSNFQMGNQNQIMQTHGYQPQPHTLAYAMPTPINNHVPLDPNDIATNWSVHKAPTGADYFYNTVTNESTYTRPPCLGLDPSSSSGSGSISISGSGSGTHVNIVTPNTVPDNKKGSASASAGEKSWSQHTDQASGKIYYSNGVTTTWEKPDSFETSETKTTTSDEPPSKRRKKKEDETQVLYSNKAEAIAAFKGLLLAKDIPPTIKWNDVVKMCSSDQRWEACSTMGERRQLLGEYQTKQANKLREAKRQEKVRAKDAFMSLLTDTLPTVSAFKASGKTSFQVIRDSLSKDDRFYAVEDEDSREELFLDFVEEMRKREDRKRRARKREAKESFLLFLKNKEDGGTLTFASTWSLFISTLDDEDKSDARFVVSEARSESDRELYFVDHIIELQKVDDEKRRRVREARRRAEKAQRDAYRETLRGLAKEGKILPSSRWRNCEELLATEDTFDAVKCQEKGTPRNMFEDFIDEWEDNYRSDKGFLNNLMAKSKDFSVAPETKYEEFTKAILDAAAYSPDAYSDARRVINDEIPISSAKVIFDELVALAKSGSVRSRNNSYGRRIADESSEDEGEIVEDGEVSDNVQSSTPSVELTS